MSTDELDVSSISAAELEDEIDVEELDRDDLEGRISLLQAENQRLRALYAETRQSSYRRTALGLAALGSVAAIGGYVFPAERDILLILAAIGLFGGLLTYYLTPERFVAADVAERVYDALATNEADLTADLGLSDTRLYLPTNDGATLFIPQNDSAPLPDPATFEGPLVVTDDTRGLALTPTGARLFDEFERTVTGPIADSPGPLLQQVTDALVEAFELVDRTEDTIDRDLGRLTVAIHGSTYPNAFDSPPASLIGVALAAGLDTPVAVETAPAQEADFSVICRWDLPGDQDDDSSD